MSAPPGWHPQPDGRERWWDGQQWTEHFRDPVAQTQQYGAVDPGQDQYGQGQYGQQAPYGQPGGYAPPPGGQYPPQKQGMSSGLKGCLIAVVVLILLAIIGAIVAVVVFGTSVRNAVDDVQKSIDAQSPGSTEVLVIQVGDGFDAGAATVENGWTVEEGDGFGQKVEGMQATFDGGGQTPTLFTMRFTGEDGSDVDTVCTAVPSDSGGPSDVTCVPLFGTVDPTADVEVSPTL